MLDNAIFVLAFIAAIGAGLMAGIFFSFSNFVMAALGRLPPPNGVAAMQAINVTVLNPGFFLTFFGTGLVCLALVAGSFVWWDQAAGKLLLIASLAYVIGCIGVTMVCNVPLNNALAAVRANTPEEAALWSRYLDHWVMWNHVRTLASLLAGISFTAALLLR